MSDFDVRLDGNSIKHQVASVNLHKGLGLFCKELKLGINDKDFLNQFDFAQIPESPRIEVLTEGELGWISEGVFFIEEPGTTIDKNKIVHTLYGRDISARLTFPFAVRISRSWDEDTTRNAIIQEILGEAGLEYDESRILSADFPIYAGSYSVTNRYPLEIVQELIGKTDGLLKTDRLNKIWVIKDEHDWDPTDIEIHAGMIQNVTTRVIHPEFGNRIKVGSFSKKNDVNVDISLEMASSYIACGESVAAKAVVTHLDGTPVADGYPVDWSSDNEDYAAWENANTHVYTHHIPEEERVATSRCAVSTLYPIRQVHSVIEVRTGLEKTVKEIKGRSITLDESTPLDYTDSVVVIDYETGYAVNTLVAGATGEVEVPVHVVVEVFVRDTQTMRINTTSGTAQDEKDMYLTMVYRKFDPAVSIESAEVVPGVDVSLDGSPKGETGENGSIYLGLVSGGLHGVIGTKTGFKHPTGDGLDNTALRIGSQAPPEEEEEEGGGDGTFLHEDAPDLLGGATGQHVHITWAQHGALHTRKHALGSAYDHDPLAGNENEIVILSAAGMPKSSGVLVSEIGGGSLAGLGDVTIADIDPGEILVKGIGDWINKTLAEAGISAVGHTHSEYLNLSSPAVLGADWDIGDGKKIKADAIWARDSDGLALYEDGGDGIFIKDGGMVGIGTPTPPSWLTINFTGIGSIHGLEVVDNRSGNAEQIIIKCNTDSSAELVFRDIPGENWKWGFRVDGASGIFYLDDHQHIQTRLKITPSGQAEFLGGDFAVTDGGTSYLLVNHTTGVVSAPDGQFLVGSGTPSGDFESYQNSNAVYKNFVARNLNAGASAQARYELYNDLGGAGAAIFLTGSGYASPWASCVGFWNGLNGPLAIATNNLLRMWISATGLVALGGTTNPASRLDIGAGAITMAEMTAPGAPAANSVVIYSVDSGGKTALMARFPTGAAQQVAIEP